MLFTHLYTNSILKGKVYRRKSYIYDGKAREEDSNTKEKRSKRYLPKTNQYDTLIWQISKAVYKETDWQTSNCNFVLCKAYLLSYGKHQKSWILCKVIS